MTNEIQEEILICTNPYTEMWIRKNEPNGGKTYVAKEELLRFFGCLIFAEVSRSSYESVEQLWGSDHGRQALLATMSLRRFENIMKFLRFDDTDTHAEPRAADKLAAFRSIWEMFQARCRECYKSSSYVCNDEQIIGFRGHASLHEIKAR